MYNIIIIIVTEITTHKKKEAIQSMQYSENLKQPHNSITTSKNKN